MLIIPESQNFCLFLIEITSLTSRKLLVLTTNIQVIPVIIKYARVWIPKLFVQPQASILSASRSVRSWRSYGNFPEIFSKATVNNPNTTIHWSKVNSSSCYAPQLNPRLNPHVWWARPSGENVPIALEKENGNKSIRVYGYIHEILSEYVLHQRINPAWKMLAVLYSLGPGFRGWSHLVRLFNRRKFALLYQ